MVYPIPACLVHPVTARRYCPADVPARGKCAKRVRSFFALGSPTCTLRRKMAERSLVSEESH
jgi:hypothetical protein